MVKTRSSTRKKHVIPVTTLAMMLTMASLTALPAQALTTLNISTLKTETTNTFVKSSIVLANTVAPPSGKGTKTVLLTGLPKEATTMQVQFTSRGAWRDTKITATFNDEKTVQPVYTALANQKQVKTVTFKLPAQGATKMVLTSSQASVALEMKIVGYTKNVQVVPTPVPTPKPVSPVAETAPKPAPTSTPVSSTPDATNTGVPAGTKLTVHNGDLKITTPGTVINGLDIKGHVVIAAANVTIKNSIIRGSDNALTATKPLVNNMGGHAGFVITDTELSPTVATPYIQGIYGYNFTATRLNIHGVIDGIHLTGGNVTVQGSWVHDHLHYLQDPNHNGSPSHDDSIQIQKGDNIVITGNRLTGPHSANMQITQDSGIVSDVTFTKNILAGGACSVNVAEKGKGAINGIIVADNKFARDTKLTNCAVISPLTTKIQLDRNYYTPDNTLVTVRRG